MVLPWDSLRSGKWFMMCGLWAIISPTNTYGTGLYFFQGGEKTRSP